MGESVGTPQLGIISESSRFGRLSLAVPALFLWIALTDQTILQLNPPNHARPRSGGLRLDIRLARWLLMAHDRIGDDTLPLTHEFLSLMLGVRRPGVTDALNALRKLGLISYQRGQITVRDRKGMERTAGEAYGTPEAEYRRLVG